MKRVVVTGAGGFIGMHACIRFLKEGWGVIGIDNLNDYYSVLLKEDRIKEIEKIANLCSEEFVFFKADLNSDIWEKIDKSSVDLVVHFAAQAGVRYSLENPLAYLEANILGFQRVLEFVQRSGIKRFIYSSSSSVYGKDTRQPFSEDSPCNAPESYYAATKKANEMMAHSYFKTHGVSSVGLRFFTVYGPWGRPDMAPMLFAKAAFEGRRIKVFNYGNQKRDFTFVDDIIEGVYQIAVLKEFPVIPLVLNIGNGTPVGLLEFIEAIEQKTGYSIEKEFVKAQKGDVNVTFADTEQLKKLIDYSPATSLDYGLDKFLDWFRIYYNYAK